MKPSPRSVIHLAPAYPVARVVTRLARVTLVLAMVFAATLPSSAGDRRSAQRAVGKVFAWGSGFANTPAEVAGLSGVVSMSTGNGHVLALKTDGKVLAWGYNAYGQLGDTTTVDRSTPVEVVGLSNVVAISAGYYFSLALKSDGTVWAWGDNTCGQLGYATINNSSTPTQVPGVSGVIAIAAGGSHSLALKSDGTVSGWGWNYDGQLGDGTFEDRGGPVLAGISNVVSIQGGYNFTLALKSDGTVWAWGGAADGQLGNGGWFHSATPVPVSGLTGVAAISARLGFHSLALKSDGTVWAWGGQAGTGLISNSATPVQSSSLSGVVSISAGTWHSLALKSDGTVWAWGRNSSGELGNGSYTDGTTPVVVSDLSGIVSIAAGGDTSLALQSQAVGAAWGDNLNGYLGNEVSGTSSVPTAVDALTGLAAISAGGFHSVGLLADGTVWTWGSNGYGEMGIGEGLAGGSTPTTLIMGGRPTVKAVATGEHHTLALTSTGAVFAWGQNENGQTGVGRVIESGWVTDIPASYQPVQVSGISAPLVAVATGAYHSLALDSGGTVWAWGANNWGQLGSPPDPYTSRSVPAQVPGEQWHSLKKTGHSLKMA